MRPHDDVDLAAEDHPPADQHLEVGSADGQLELLALTGSLSTDAHCAPFSQMSELHNALLRDQRKTPGDLLARFQCSSSDSLSSSRPARARCRTE